MSWEGRAMSMLNRRQFAAAGAAMLLWPPGRAAAADADELAGLGIRQAAALLRSRRVSPVQLVEACLDRIGRLDPGLNSFITLTAGQALSRARECEDELRRGQSRGPLHGIPLALKDNIDTAGIRTTAAAAALEARVPTADAEVVRRLNAAGAILLGKLNMDECAYGVASVSGHFGAVRNPWQRGHVAGGSSGGPAAAVAARLCFGALGTDTGGSIRQPAAWCGITGLKPSHGLVSTRGVLPLAWSLDHVGPMCRSADDAGLLLAAVAGHDPADPGSLLLEPGGYAGTARRRLRGLRLAVVEAMGTDVDPEMESAVGRAIDGLAALMRRVAPVALPATPRLSLTFVEAASALGPLLDENPAGFSPAVQQLVETGRATSATRYAGDRRALDLARNEIRRLFADVDLLVMPTTPDLPMTLEQALTPAAAFGPPLSARNTTPFNVFGLPTLSLPCGFSRGGLPIGLQLAGPPGGDALLLDVARAYQATTDWHRRAPDA